MLNIILLTVCALASIWFAEKCFEWDNFGLFLFALLLVGIFILWFVLSVSEVISCAIP